MFIDIRYVKYQIETPIYEFRFILFIYLKASRKSAILDITLGFYKALWSR